MQPGDPKRLEPGVVLANRYEIIEFLNEGGMGALYKGKHLEVEREVAVKLLKADPEENDESFKRFRQEAKIAGSLNHTNVTSVYDFGKTEDGWPFLVMDFLHGETLEQRLKETGPLEIPEAVSLFLQICDGLKHAHDKELIHRDLKPSNIMLVKEDSKDLVKVMDFGIAKALNPKTAQNLTRTGEVFGSPLYMSPEQCLSQQLDARSDIYSLGCMMYEALTGSAPHMGDGPLQTMYKHMNDSPPPICQEYPDLLIPDDLEELVFKCMEKNPDNRFQTIEDLSNSLRVIMSVSIGRQNKPAAKLIAAATNQPDATSAIKQATTAIICVSLVTIAAAGAYFSWQQLGAIKIEKSFTVTTNPAKEEPEKSGLDPVDTTEAKSPDTAKPADKPVEEKPVTPETTKNGNTKASVSAKTDAINKAVQESSQPIIKARATVKPELIVATTGSIPNANSNARIATNEISGSNLRVSETKLTPEQTVLNRLRTTTVPALKLSVDEITDCKISWNIDWDSFSTSPEATMNLEHQGLYVIRAALASVCNDRIGRNAVKGKIKAINVKNVDSPAQKSITFANGILSINGAWAASWNGYPSESSIKKAVENGL